MQLFGFDKAFSYRTGTGLSVLLLAMTVWFLDGMGATAALDNVAYDACARLMTIIRPSKPHAALVYIDGEEDEKSLERLIDKLNEMSPRCLALTFVPQQFRTSGDREIPIVIPTRHLLDPVALETPVKLESASPHAERCVLSLTDSSDGVARWHVSRVQLANGLVPTLEAEVVSTAKPACKTPDRFRIGYHRGPGSLPFITASQVLSDSIVPELVRGRVVLIGHWPKTPYDRVSTAATPGATWMAPLEFHGHVVNTLLSDNAVVDLSTWYRLALCLATGVALALWQAAGGGNRLQHLIVVSVLTLVVAIAVLLVNQVWIAPSSLWVLQLGSWILFLQRRSANQSREVRAFGMELIGTARRRAWPVQFVAADNPWMHVAEMIDQLLSPDRLVLMRAEPGQMYVSEVAAIGCTFDSISERRRDYRREPYATAMALGRPSPAHETRCILSPVDGEHQYLSPLVFRGELVGFCMLGVNANVVASDSSYLETFEQLSAQAAEMIRRAELDHAQRRVKEPTAGKLDVEETLAEMGVAARVLTGRVMRMEDVFRSAPSPAYVFDLYGNSLLINDQMNELLGELGGRAGNSPLQLLSSISEESEESIQRRLRKVVMNGTTEKWPIHLRQSRQPHLITMTPITVYAMGQRADDVYPFDLLGVRVDLQPGVAVSAMEWLEEDVNDITPVAAVGKG